MTGMYLEHYGVKGMEWGKKKKVDPQMTTISAVKSGVGRGVTKNVSDSFERAKEKIAIRSTKGYKITSNAISNAAQQIATSAEKIQNAKKKVETVVNKSTNKKVSSLNKKTVSIGSNFLASVMTTVTKNSIRSTSGKAMNKITKKKK